MNKIVVVPIALEGFEVPETLDFSSVSSIIVNPLFSYRPEENHYYFNILSEKKLTRKEYDEVMAILQQGFETIEYWESNEFEDTYGISIAEMTFENVGKVGIDETRDYHRVKTVKIDEEKFIFHYIDSSID
jgi:hypothetical protein